MRMLSMVTGLWPVMPRGMLLLILMLMAVLPVLMLMNFADDRTYLFEKKRRSKRATLHAQVARFFSCPSLWRGGSSKPRPCSPPAGAGAGARTACASFPAEAWGGQTTRHDARRPRATLRNGPRRRCVILRGAWRGAQHGPPETRSPVWPPCSSGARIQASGGEALLLLQSSSGWRPRGRHDAGRTSYPPPEPS